MSDASIASTNADGLRVPVHGHGRLVTWQKGQSGNPSGVGLSEYHKARKVCAQHTQEAIARQIQLMRESTDDRVVMIATQAIIDRGVGKPRDHSGETPNKIDLSTLTPAERDAMVELLKKAMGL